MEAVTVTFTSAGMTGHSHASMSSGQTEATARLGKKGGQGERLGIR